MAVNPALILGGAQGALGVYQLAKAAQFAKKPRPNYIVPKEITDNANMAKNAYGASTMYGLPGQGKVLAGLYRNQANSLNAINQSQQSPTAMLGGIAAVDANTKNATNTLGMNAANFRANQMRQTRGEVYNTGGILASYKDKAFKYNQDDPYQASMAAASAMRGAAINNLFGAGTAVVGAVGTGGKKTPNTTTTGSPNAGIKMEAPTGLGTQSQISTGEQQQFPALYDDATYARYRTKFPYSAMTDEQFYKAMADLQGSNQTIQTGQ